MVMEFRLDRVFDCKMAKPLDDVLNLIKKLYDVNGYIMLERLYTGSTIEFFYKDTFDVNDPEPLALSLEEPIHTILWNKNQLRVFAGDTCLEFTKVGDTSC